jgi:hypothetical protein
MNPRGPHPIEIGVEPTAGPRDRLTSALRFILAFPHVLMVGAPVATVLTWFSTSGEGPIRLVGTGGTLGAAAGMGAVIGWFWIIVTGRLPDGLWKLGAFYLRWRVRAVAYTMLLRDGFPPFGEGDYPVELAARPPEAPRDRLTVGFRIILIIPHLIAVLGLGLAWILATIVAWFAILVTGRYPAGLWEFGVGVLRWNTRVEGYMLLLHDDYPPFSLD